MVFAAGGGEQCSYLWQKALKLCRLASSSSNLCMGQPTGYGWGVAEGQNIMQVG